jgi:hypothetical protein
MHDLIIRSDQHIATVPAGLNAIVRQMFLGEPGGLISSVVRGQWHVLTASGESIATRADEFLTLKSVPG